jgi:hypothetical protein
MPRGARNISILLNLPAAELLVEPPSVLAITGFEVREPFGDDTYKRGIDADAHSYTSSGTVRTSGNGANSYGEETSSRKMSIDVAHTNESYNEPALSCTRHAFSLGPEPARSHFPARTTPALRSGVSRMSQPSIPLDYRVLNPVCG